VGHAGGVPSGRQGATLNRMPPPSLVTVLFDLDGTLIDSIELIVKSARFAFASRPGPSPTDEEFMAGIGQPLVAQFGPYAGTPEEMQALIAAYRHYQLENHDRLTTLYDGVLDLVLALKDDGRPLGVVTSKMDAIARRSLSHVGLLDLFDVVVGMDHTQHHKPRPEPVQFALNRLGVAPGAASYIGDSPFDIEAGNAAGVTSIAVTWGAFSRDTLATASPSYTVDRPADLLPLIRELDGAEDPGPLKPYG